MHSFKHAENPGRNDRLCACCSKFFILFLIVTEFSGKQNYSTIRFNFETNVTTLDLSRTSMYCKLTLKLPLMTQWQRE